MIDPDRLQHVRASWSLGDIERGKLPEELSALDADLILVGDLAAANLGKVRGSSFSSSRVELTRRLVQPDNAQVIASFHSQSTKMALDLGAAGRKAAAAAAQITAEKIIQGLPELASRPRTLDLVVDEAELATRREGWEPLPPRYTTGVLGKYAKLVGSAAKGAICG